ncbi:MAG: hypothetical protein ABIZ81_11835 [Opitutaceae bacterium]
MPEALVIAALFFIAGAVYLYARLQANDPALHDPARDRARLQCHAVWLEDRLRIARREKWDDQMVSNLSIELETTCRQLTRVTTPLVH